MTISKIVFAITGVLGSGQSRAGSSPSKDDKGTFKKWLDRLADALKRLAGKAVEALSATVWKCCWCRLKFSRKYR